MDWHKWLRLPCKISTAVMVKAALTMYRVDDRACLSVSDCTDGFCNSAYVCVPDVCGADAQVPKCAMAVSVVKCNRNKPCLEDRGRSGGICLEAQPAAMIQDCIGERICGDGGRCQNPACSEIRSNQTMSSQPPQRYLKAPKRLSSVPPSMMGPG